MAIAKREDGTWDSNIGFDSTKSLLLERMVASREECKPDADGFLDPSGPVKLCHYNTMMVQLRTASRASEALDSMMSWVKDGNRRPVCRVRKRSPRCESCHHIKTGGRGSKVSGHEVLGGGLRGKCQRPDCTTCTGYKADPKDVVERIVRIPLECLDSDRAIMRPVVERGMSVDSYITFARRHLVNSHSFRYAGTNELRRMKVPIETIAQVLGHASPNMTFHYFQRKDADAAADELAGVGAES